MLLAHTNLNWIKDLIIRPKPTKLQNKNGNIFLDIGLRNDFMDMTPKTQATKQTKKWSYIRPLVKYSTNLIPVNCT